MQDLLISALDATDDPVEVVERKGIGHPDTICDALAETLSLDLCREYLRVFGQILHHNVDKALLCGGRAAPAFGGGSVLSPITIYLGGRATARMENQKIDIKEVAVEGSRRWLRENMHALDAERDVEIHELVQPGSQDLQGLFSRHGRDRVPLANDTSIGVGYAPMTKLERLVLSVERQINARDRAHRAWGEDVKIMGIRRGETAQLTVACAMIGRHLSHTDDYLNQKAAIATMAQRLAAKQGFPGCQVTVNAADDPAAGSIYLTVTGTSAESGDDGQVGRGNRVNGLITPGRPMSLEAAAGKNPVSHVGKIYNILARNICESLIADSPQISSAHCLLVSQIGTPITRPAIVRIKIATVDKAPLEKFRDRIEEITVAQLDNAHKLTDDLMSGRFAVF